MEEGQINCTPSKSNTANNSFYDRIRIWTNLFLRSSWKLYISHTQQGWSTVAYPSGHLTTFSKYVAVQVSKVRKENFAQSDLILKENKEK